MIMYNLSLAFHEKELVKDVIDHVLEDDHSIILINDLGILNIITSYDPEEIDKLRKTIEHKLIAKKDELYKTLSSFLPTLTPASKELILKNLQGVFKNLNESRFYDLTN